ncbi:MAG: hypothetical protein QOJ67_2574 [Acidimicrobiaceae bacterium]
MDVRVLGDVEVRRGGARTPLPGASCRAVLAMLALREGGVLSVDEIIDGLWAVDLPGDPVAAVHVTISRLRGALGEDRGVVSRHPLGYSLDLDPSLIDVGRAAAALRQGRAALDLADLDAAVSQLSDGLAEWRGQPLAEFADLPFAGPAVSRIHLLRLSLVETRNRALLASGRPSDVLDATSEALAADPWREELVGQLMLALYQCGRQVEALTAYAQLSSALRRDFGIAPSALLEVLHDRILSHDRELELPTTAARLTALDETSLPRWFKAALDADAEQDDRVRCRLLLALGEAQHYAGDAGWQETLLEAGRLAHSMNDTSSLARAALGGALGWSLEPGTADARRIELLEHALADGDALDLGMRARLLAAHTTELTFTADLEQRVSMSDEAVRLARESGEPATLLTVLSQRFNAIWAPETLEDRRQHLSHVAQLAETTGLPIAEALAHGWHMAASIEVGDLDAADQHLARFTALAEQLDLPLLRWGAVLHSSWRAVISGDLDKADTLCEEAQLVGTRANRPEVQIVAATQRVGIRWAQARLAEEVGTLTDLCQALPRFKALQASLALALHHAGDRDRAHAMLTTACTDGSIATLQRNQVYLSALISWADLAHETDDAHAAAHITTQLEPHASQFAFTGTAVYGPVTHALALLALTNRDVGSASRHLASARRLVARMPAPWFADRTEQTIAKHGLTLSVDSEGRM